MKKYLVTFTILALAVSAGATFPGSPIGGGSSGASLTTGSVTSDYILDNYQPSATGWTGPPIIFLLR